jgi:integrase
MTTTSRGKITKRVWKYCEEHGAPKNCRASGCRKAKPRTAYGYSLLVVEDGARRRVRRQFATKAEAEDELDKYKEELKRPKIQPAPEKITLNAYADTWLKRIESHLAPRTVKSYRELLTLYVRPMLGTMTLADIQRVQIKDLLGAKRDSGLSKNTVRLIRATLSVVFSDAVDDGLLQTNPTQGLARRGRKRADGMTSTERRQAIRPMTYEQLAAFLSAAETRRETDATEAARDATPAEQWRDRRDYTLLLTLADAGLRPGEALGLKWEDVDLADRSLRIARAVSHGEVRATKTGETRHVDLTPRLSDALRRWQTALKPDAAATGDLSDWVFPSDARTPLDEINVARGFRGLLAKAKIPHFRLYDLRHTFATHLLAESAPITYVAAQLGHAKPTTTLAFYAHWLPSGDKGLIDRLEVARSALKPPAVAQDGRKESGGPRRAS